MRQMDIDLIVIDDENIPYMKRLDKYFNELTDVLKAPLDLFVYNSREFEDMKAAQDSCNTGNFDWACFQCRQAAEKALKALWYFHGVDPWGHSVLNLINSFPKEISLAEYIEAAQLLDKLYIPTRYPNGLPEPSPFEVFSRKDADAAIRAAGRIVEFVSSYVSA